MPARVETTTANQKLSRLCETRKPAKGSIISLGIGKDEDSSVINAKSPK